MNKSLLGISMDVMNAIWSVGTETYKVVKNEVNNAIDNEAEIRTRKVLGNKIITRWNFRESILKSEIKLRKRLKS